MSRKAERVVGDARLRRWYGGMDELEARARKNSVRSLTAAGDMDVVQYVLQVQDIGLRGVACPEGALVAGAICIFACAHASKSVHDLECAALTLRVYNHLLHALLGENLVGAVVPMYDNIGRPSWSHTATPTTLLSKSCARTTGSTQRARCL
jgi:hypothetical protein